MNQPYVIQMNELGQVTNPIIRSYVSEFPNRKARREPIQRFRKNSKGINLTINKMGKFERAIQVITHSYERNKKGEITKVNLLPTPKRIFHYLAR